MHRLLASLAESLVPLAASAPVLAAETESAIARGGRLYDRWYAENKAAKPTTDHPARTIKAGQYGKDGSWRCKLRHLASGRAEGRAAKGEAYFNTLYAGCHGVDGKQVKDGPPLGSVADNGAEMMHKLLNGQAGEAMLALRALDRQISAGIAVRLTSLPK